LAIEYRRLVVVPLAASTPIILFAKMLKFSKIDFSTKKEFVKENGRIF
jgi:hypothetical protein